MVRAVWGILLGCVWSVPLIAAERPDDLYGTDTFTDHALEFIEEAVTQTQRPFFLSLPHIAAGAGGIGAADERLRGADRLH